MHVRQAGVTLQELWLDKCRLRAESTQVWPAYCKGGLFVGTVSVHFILYFHTRDCIKLYTDLITFF